MQSRGGVVKDAVEYLTNCMDSQFEPIEPIMRVWSFSNGVYHGDQDLFYPYNADTGIPTLVRQGPGGVREASPQDILSADVISCKYIPHNFNEEAAATPCTGFGDSYQDVAADGNHWWHIPTPNFDKIPRYQRMSFGVTQWLWVFRGRPFYKMKELDNWQVLPLLRGAGGTGKTTVTQNIKKTHPHEKVPTMSSNIERQFGLGMLRNGWSYIIPELRTDSFNLPEGEMLQIISGDPVSLSIKHGDAEQLEEWVLHGTAAANNPLQIMDTQGAWSRRIVEFEFPHILTSEQVDPMLEQKLDEELPNIILKSNRAYRAACRQYGNSTIWKVLPREFLDLRSRLERRCNPMQGFMMDDSIIMQWPKGKTANDEEPEHPLFCTISELREAFGEYCRIHNVRKGVVFDEDLYKSHFEQHGVRSSRHRPGHENETGKFFVNIRVCLAEALQGDGRMIGRQQAGTLAGAATSLSAAPDE
jgi:hypothetical protein